MITFKNSTTYSGKRIEVFDGQNIFNIYIEYYEKDNIFEMEWIYKWSATDVTKL